MTAATLEWDEVSEHHFVVVSGPFKGAECTYELGRGWLIWRGRTLDLGRHGGIHDAADALARHPGASS